MSPRSTITVAIVLGLLAGCRTPMPCNQRSLVSSELVCRAGAELGSNCGVSSSSVPPGVAVVDGITADEAVSIALWNNAALGELLSQLGVSRAQLYDSGLISDPQLILLLPMGPKQFELTTFQAVDELWLRPIRRRAAELDLCELSRQMIQNGLNTARDVRLAHADLVLAQDRKQLTDESHRLRQAIQSLAEKRLVAGDISDLEVTTTAIDALTAKATSASAVHDVTLAQERLRTLMGLSLSADEIVAAQSDRLLLETDDKDSLVALAHAMRPDLRALEIRKNAVCRRLELAQKQFMRFEGGYDANSDGEKGFESGPALRMTLPIFNRNRGQIAIAQALVHQVDTQFVSLRDQIELDVRSAITQFNQAQEQLRLIDDEILPVLEEAQELSQRNYINGGVPYFLVLQTTGQFVDAQLRRATALAATRRALAQLERGIGQRLPMHNQLTGEDSLEPLE